MFLLICTISRQITPEFFEDGLHVEAVPVKHASDMKCCGLLICDEEETTYFSADASELSDDILQQFKQGKIQVIYHDCTF